jgi:hypothetical protein
MFCLDVEVVAARKCTDASRVGTIRTASKIEGPNIREYLQIRKRPLPEIVGRMNMVSRPISGLGKANDLCEETVESNIDAIGLGGRALNERIIEITSGRSIFQQGLATTCKDLSP